MGKTPSPVPESGVVFPGKIGYNGPNSRRKVYMMKDIIQAAGLYLLIINAVGFLLMGLDKRRAKRGAWRISEKNLFLPPLLGGTVGALSLIHISEPTRQAEISYAVFCLKKKTKKRKRNMKA